MVAVIVRHRVSNFDAWKAGFDEHGSVRRSHGALGHQLYRVTADPQEVIIVNTFRDAAGAQAFMDDPSLPEVMARAGVVDAPDLYVSEQVEVVDYPVTVG
jgi:heme-degrading monooxygenase HmoA